MCGSSANTSRPAALMTPPCSAATSAGSSTIDPRAMLTSVPFFPSAASTSASTMFLVAAPPGHATIRKSAAAASPSRSGMYWNGTSCGLRPV